MLSLIHIFHRYEVLHNKLSGLEVLPVDCNPVEIQSVFHNPLVELAVYRHPCHHQKTGQPHPSGMEVYWRICMTHKKLICKLR